MASVQHHRGVDVSRGVLTPHRRANETRVRRVWIGLICKIDLSCPVGHGNSGGVWLLGTWKGLLSGVRMLAVARTPMEPFLRPYARGALSPPAAAREKVLACSRVSGHVIVWAGSGLGIGRANVNVDMVARCSQCKYSAAIRYAIRGAIIRYAIPIHLHTYVPCTRVPPAACADRRVRARCRPASSAAGRLPGAAPAGLGASPSSLIRQFYHLVVTS